MFQKKFILEKVNENLLKIFRILDPEKVPTLLFFEKCLIRIQNFLKLLEPDPDPYIMKKDRHEATQFKIYQQ